MNQAPPLISPLAPPLAPPLASLLAQGAAHYAAGRHAAAETVARAVLAEAPGDLRARHVLAACRIAAGALDEGAAELEAVLAAAPGGDAVQDEVRLQLARVRARQGRHAAVVALLDEVVRRRPALVAAYRPLAAAQWELGARDAAIDVWRALVALLPEDGEALRALGDALRQNGRPDAAAATLRRAAGLLDGRPGLLAARIGLAEALAELAEAALPGGAEEQAAAAAAHAALALGPSDPTSLTRIGIALFRIGDAAAAIAVLRRVDLDHSAADVAEVLDHLGTAQMHAFDLDAAEAAFAALIVRQPDNAKAHLHLGMLRLLRGDFAAGWRGYEWRRGQLTQLPAPQDPRAPPWSVPARLDGQSVRVVLEQGHGDTLHFARYLPLLAARGARVELAMPIHATLRPLLAEMAAVAAIVPLADMPPVPATVLPLLSLPLAFGTDLASVPAAVPYLVVPADRMAAWRARLDEVPDRRPRIGVAWAGSPTFRNDRRRSVPTGQFRRLLRRPDLAFHVLADRLRDGDAGQIGGLAEVHAGIVDFADTAALIAAMDLVITVDTAVAHLAGALGRPVWVLLPHCPDWRWLLGRDDSPWYPTARLFRQPAPGDWDSVLARVEEALDARFR